MFTKNGLLLCVITVFYLGLTQGCSTSQQSPRESGVFWCNERYLHEKSDPFGKKHLDVARKGYIYVLASALALQGDGTEDNTDHYFEAPGRMRLIDSARHNKFDFEARTYHLYTDDSLTDLEEIIVAFAGTNSIDDWRANLFPVYGRQHYKMARDYVKRAAEDPENTGVRLVVTGFSLGGGLSVHVTKHEETSQYIAEAWVFNSSPKTYSNGKKDKRIWSAAMKGEALVSARWLFRLLPGVTGIAAPSNQRAEEYYLVNSNPLYKHSRWVLVRAMLHVADLALYDRLTGKTATTEPQEILQSSRSIGCMSDNIVTSSQL